MSEIIFVGEPREIQPYRLLGIRTLSLPEGEDDLSWVKDLSDGRYSVIILSEKIQNSRPAALEALWESLAPRTALTIIPDPARPQSEHLQLLRRQTVEALGIDTWTADIDKASGKKEWNMAR